MPRDTDLDWQLIAAHQPYFGVLSNERYRSENLTPEAIEEFYGTGRGDIAHIAEVLRGVGGGEFAPATALDFGCGVGRLAFAMAEHAGQVTGVDVAEPMLDVARKQAAERGVSNVAFRTDLPGGTVEWVNSFIVFQHIPPARGTELFEQLVRQLAPGGFLSLQLTFFHDRRHLGEVQRDLLDYRYDGEVIELLSTPDAEAGGMTMFDYDLNRIFRILFTGGVESVRADHTDHAGCHGVLLLGRKGADAPAPPPPSAPAAATATSLKPAKWWKRR